MIARNKGDEEGCMITRRLMICTTLYDGRYRLHSVASMEITCMTNTHTKRNMVSIECAIQRPAKACISNQITTHHTSLTKHHRSKVAV